MFAVKRQGAVDVVEPKVPLKGEYVEELHETIVHCHHKGVPMVVLNLHDVPLLDSAGLEGLLDVKDQVEAHRGFVKLAAFSPLVRDILRVSGVEQSFELFEDVKAAVRSFVQ